MLASAPPSRTGSMAPSCGTFLGWSSWENKWNCHAWPRCLFLRAERSPPLKLAFWPFPQPAAPTAPPRHSIQRLVPAQVPQARPGVNSKSASANPHRFGSNMSPAALSSTMRCRLAGSVISRQAGRPGRSVKLAAVSLGSPPSQPASRARVLPLMSQYLESSVSGGTLPHPRPPAHHPPAYYRAAALGRRRRRKLTPPSSLPWLPPLPCPAGPGVAL